MQSTSRSIALSLGLLLVLGSWTVAQPPLAGPAGPAACGPGSPCNNIPPGLDFPCATPSGCDCGTSIFLERKIHPEPCVPCEPKTYGCPEAPFWYVEADAIALMRDPDSDRAFATLGPDDGDPVFALSSGDLEYGFRPGGRLLLGRMLGPRYGLETTVLVADDWAESLAVRDNTANGLGGFGNLFSPFTDFGNPPVDGLDYNNLAMIREASSFTSVEINIRQRLEMPPIPMQGSLFYGIRYIDIGEDFNYYTESDLPSANAVDVSTDNRLLGVQLGALFEFHVEPRWWVNLRMSAALCGNDARQTTLYTATDELGISTEFAGDRDDLVTAFAGELSLAFTYYITPNLMTRLGWRGLWIEGLALAAENFEEDINILTLGPAGLVDDGKVIYHGPFLGTAMVW